ncbi:lipocalin family protein [uncultured Tenacibaculum sp.]|uniref:lipocalin family protein n=1 Tax=uncultured Tenacibaculum sp. TaxID=174713 RepID=UPI0026149EAA|nr:lipocalin family protein [uncultured Tenacibaculum sp.]
MKKLLSIAAAILLFVSCSDEETVSDPIIGTWKLEKQVIVDNGQTIDETNECTKQSTLVFNSNGTTTSELFGGTDASNCTSDGVDKGTWKSNGSNIYEVLEDGETTPEVFTINFTDNNTKFTFGATTWKKQ